MSSNPLKDLQDFLSDMLSIPEAEPPYALGDLSRDRRASQQRLKAELEETRDLALTEIAKVESKLADPDGLRRGGVEDSKIDIARRRIAASEESYRAGDFRSAYQQAYLANAHLPMSEEEERLLSETVDAAYRFARRDR